VVFGDIGTSPLYTLKTVLDLTGDGSSATVLGILSLIVWTLIAITSIKYVIIATRVDNDGEGGILALMALLGVKRTAAPRVPGCTRRRTSGHVGVGTVEPVFDVPGRGSDDRSPMTGPTRTRRPLARRAAYRAEALFHRVARRGAIAPPGLCPQNRPLAPLGWPTAGRQGSLVGFNG
jgi:hypothetical protein